MTRSFAACLVLVFAGGPVRALPLISEVYYDAVGSDDGVSFVELYGAPGTLLDGLSVEVVNGADGAVVATLALTGSFGVDGLFVVADRTASGESAIAEADQLLNFDIQNGPDSLLLRAAEGILDAVGFGEFADGEVFAGEGLPAVDVAAGSSLARRFADADTDDNAADFLELAAPTPGSAPLTPVPEPSSAALSAAMLVGLAAAGRWWRRAPQT